MGDDSTTTGRTFAEAVTLPTRGENAIPHLLAVFHHLTSPSTSTRRVPSQQFHVYSSFPPLTTLSVLRSSCNSVSR